MASDLGNLKIYRSTLNLGYKSFHITPVKDIYVDLETEGQMLLLTEFGKESI